MQAGLKDFILRGEVLKLYRNFLKVARQAPNNAGGGWALGQRGGQAGRGPPAWPTTAS